MAALPVIANPAGVEAGTNRNRFHQQFYWTTAGVAWGADPSLTGGMVFRDPRAGGASAAAKPVRTDILHAARTALKPGGVMPW